MKPPLGRLIAFGNQKGGVGKTTTCFNIGAALAKQGRSVCIVDVDPNRGLSRFLKFHEDSPNTSYDIFMGDCAAQDALRFGEIEGDNKGEKVIVQIPENMGIVPGSRELEGLQIKAYENPDLDIKRNFEIATDFYTAHFDYVFVDTAPNLTHSTVTAYNTVPWFILTATADMLAIDSLTDAVEDLLTVKEGGAEGRLLGVTLTYIEERTTLSKSIIGFCEEEFIADLPDGKKVSLYFEDHISKTVGINEAAFVAKSIFDYNPKNKACAEYEALAEDIEKRISKFEKMFNIAPRNELPPQRLVGNE